MNAGNLWPQSFKTQGLQMEKKTKTKSVCDKKIKNRLLLKDINHRAQSAYKQFN